MKRLPAWVLPVDQAYDMHDSLSFNDEAVCDTLLCVMRSLSVDSSEQGACINWYA